MRNWGTKKKVIVGSILFLFIIIVSIFVVKQIQVKGTKKVTTGYQLPDTLEPGIYAVFQTSMGDFVCKLYKDKAPITVDNFIGLAKGTKEFKDPITGEITKKPFYDGLIFHRVIKNFMIQGGDPLGTGVGGPGYKFRTETDPSLKHDKPGILAMANSGPNTNGSQFYITVVPTPWLDGGYNVFGETVVGQDVVKEISEVQTGANDKPLTPVVLKKVEIIEKK